MQVILLKLSGTQHCTRNIQKEEFEYLFILSSDNLEINQHSLIKHYKLFSLR